MTSDGMTTWDVMLIALVLGAMLILGQCRAVSAAPADQARPTRPATEQRVTRLQTWCPAPNVRLADGTCRRTTRIGNGGRGVRAPGVPTPRPQGR